MKESYLPAIVLMPSSLMKENSWSRNCFISILRNYSLLGGVSVDSENYINCNVIVTVLRLTASSHILFLVFFLAFQTTL